MRQQDDRHRPLRPPIVVGIDGSPGSKAALRWALGHAERTSAEVEAVSVWDTQPALYCGAEWASAVCAGNDLGADAESGHVAAAPPGTGSTTRRSPRTCFLEAA